MYHHVKKLMYTVRVEHVTLVEQDKVHAGILSPSASLPRGQANGR